MGFGEDVSKSQKGGGFEREISKTLSRWWTGGARDDVIWRTQQSGGRATQRRKSGRTTAGQNGDLAATDADAAVLFQHLIIECKCGYARWCVLDVIDAPKATPAIFDVWMDKLETDRQAAGAKWGVLIARRHARKPIIVVDSDLFGRCLDLYGGSLSGVIRHGRWRIMRLDRFLKWCQPQLFRGM